MTGDNSTTRKKAGAVFFAAIMVVSMMAVGFAGFAGTAAAANTGSVTPTDTGAGSVTTHTLTADYDGATEPADLNEFSATYTDNAADLGDASVASVTVAATPIDSTNYDATIDAGAGTVTIDFTVGDTQQVSPNDVVDVELTGVQNPTDAASHNVDLQVSTSGDESGAFGASYSAVISPTLEEDPAAAGDNVTLTFAEAQYNDADNVTVVHEYDGTAKQAEYDGTDSYDVTFDAAQGTQDLSVIVNGDDVTTEQYTADNYLVEVSPSEVTWGDSVTLEGAIYKSPGVLADSQNIDYSLIFDDSDGAPDNVEVASSDTSNGEFIITTTFDIEDNNYLKDYPDDDGNGPAYTVVVNDGPDEATIANAQGSEIVETRVDVTADTDPAELTYRESGDVTGTIADTDGGLADYAVALRDPSPTAVKSSTTNNNGDYGFTASFTDAGQWEVVTNEGGTVSYETITVGPQEADVSIEAAGENLANFEETYTISVSDSNGDAISTSDGTVTGSVNVTGPFDEDLTGKTFVKDLGTADIDDDGNDETLWFTTDTDGNGEATFTTTPVGDSVDVTLENPDADGLEITDDAANTPESPDYTGSDSVTVNGAEPVNVIGFETEDPQDVNPASATDGNPPYTVLADDSGPDTVEVLPLAQNDGEGNDLRRDNGLRLGYDANQDFDGMTQYRMGFQLTDDNNENIEPGDLNEIEIVGAGINGSVVSDGATTATVEGTNVVDANYAGGQYYVLVRPTEVTEAEEQIEITFDVPNEEPVTETLNTSGLHVEQFNVDGEEDADSVPGSSTIDVESVIEDATSNDAPINNGRVRVSQSGNQIAQIDARTGNVNNGEYNFTDIQVGPRGIDNDNNGIGEDISDLTFTAYQYEDASEDQALEQTEVTKATVQNLDIELQENLEVTYDAENTSTYAGTDNGTFTLTRGVEYDQVAFELTDSDGPVDLTEGIDNTNVALNDIAYDASADEKLVTLTTTDANGDEVELDVRFDETASTPSDGYYVVSDIEANGDVNVSSTGALADNADSFVFDGTRDADAQPFTLNVETPDRSQATASDTGTFNADNAQIDTEVVGVTSDNINGTSWNDLSHDQTDTEFNATEDIETPTIGVDRTYRVNGTATDALGTPLNGSAVADVVVTNPGLVNAADAANLEFVSGPGVSGADATDVEIDNENGTFQFDFEPNDGTDDGLLTPTFEVEAQEDTTAAPTGQSAITGTPTAQNPVVEVYSQNGGTLPVNEDTGNQILANGLQNNLRIEAFPADADDFVLPDGLNFEMDGNFGENSVATSTQNIEDVETSSLATEGYEAGQVGFLQATPTGTGLSFADLTDEAGAQITDTDGNAIQFDVLSTNRELNLDVSPAVPTAADNVEITAIDSSTSDPVDQVSVTVQSPSGSTTTVQTNANGTATVNASFLNEAGTYGIDTRRAGYADGSASFTVDEAPEVSLENVNLEPDTVESNTSNNHTLTFDAVTVSDDGNTDTFTVTIPNAAELESLNGASVVDADGDTVQIEDSNVSGNVITVDVAPDSNATTRDLTVEADVTVAAPNVSAETTADITIDVADSTYGQDSAAATLTVQPDVAGEHPSGVSQELFDAVDSDGDGTVERSDVRTMINGYAQNGKVNGVAIDRNDVRDLINFYAQQ